MLQCVNDLNCSGSCGVSRGPTTPQGFLQLCCCPTARMLLSQYCVGLGLPCAARDQNCISQQLEPSQFARSKHGFHIHLQAKAHLRSPFIPPPKLHQHHGVTCGVLGMGSTPIPLQLNGVHRSSLVPACPQPYECFPSVLRRLVLRMCSGAEIAAEGLAW